MSFLCYPLFWPQHVILNDFKCNKFSMENKLKIYNFGILMQCVIPKIYGVVLKTFAKWTLMNVFSCCFLVHCNLHWPSTSRLEARDKLLNVRFMCIPLGIRFREISFYIAFWQKFAKNNTLTWCNLLLLTSYQYFLGGDNVINLILGSYWFQYEVHTCHIVAKN